MSILKGWRNVFVCLALLVMGKAGGLSAEPAGPSGPHVVVTIKPIHALVARIMQGAGTPALLITGTASPHSYAMRPSDAKALNGADVFIRVSPAIEPFTVKVVEALPSTVRVVTLIDAPGLELLNRRSGNSFESHGLSQDNADDHRENYHTDQHADGATRDGHVWLDPRNAKAMAGEIARVLAEVGPESAELFTANLAKLKADLDAVEVVIAGDLQGAKGKPFVVFHDAYQYFERRFGLYAVGSITVSPDVQPSARRLTQIRRKIDELKAGCVFAEPLVSENLVHAVTEGTPARAGVLDPEGLSIPAGPNAYFELMRGLAAGVNGCFE